MLKKILKTIKNHFCNRKCKKTKHALRWAIVGTGYMAHIFGKALNNSKDNVLYCVCSRSQDRAELYSRELLGCKQYSAYESMLEDDEIDVVYIATPVETHYQLILSALLSHKNVLCEKPIVLKIEEFEHLVKVAKSNNCFLMEGMWMKCLPTYGKAKELVADGRIGEINLIKCDFYKKNIISKKHSTGVITDFGTYALSFPLGFEKSSVKNCVAFSQNNEGVDLDWQINFSFDSGVVAFLNLSSRFFGKSGACIFGNSGYIEFDSQFNRTNTIRLYDKTNRVIEIFKYKYTNDGFEYEINEVFTSLKQGFLESQKCPLSESLETIRILEKIMSENGERR